MSIDKESSGMPEMSVRKRTTKVNLSIIASVLLFFMIMVAVAAWLWSSSP